MLLVVSCDEGGEPDAGGTVVEKYAGDWFLSAYRVDADGNIEQVDDGNGVMVDNVWYEHTIYSTYNTAENNNEMWIDDAHNNGDDDLYIKSKFTLNLDKGTFVSEEDTANIGYTDGRTLTITEGAFFKGLGKTKGGNAVDSLKLKVTDAVNGTYILAGHKRTGFLEDEY